MDDIVKRIRQQSYFGPEPYEAADEIEQLRQRVAELEEVHRQTVDKGVAGFEALVKRVRELEELLKESYKDADEVLRPRVAELEKERNDWQEAFRLYVADYELVCAERDALKQQRDELLAAIKKFLDENNPEGFGCACEPDRLCGTCSEAKRQRPLYAAIASVKEK